MPCYNSIDGEPASVSATDYRQNFFGREWDLTDCVSVITAASAMPTKSSGSERLLEKQDFLPWKQGWTWRCRKLIGYGEKLKEMFRSGQADTELLDRTVLRVLEAKFRMGLFEQPSQWTVSPQKRF